MNDLIHSDSRWLADGTGVRLHPKIREAEARGGTVRYLGGRDFVRVEAREAMRETKRPGWHRRREERRQARTIAAQQMQRERRELRPRAQE